MFVLQFNTLYIFLASNSKQMVNNSFAIMCQPIKVRHRLLLIEVNLVILHDKLGQTLAWTYRDP